MPVNIINKNVFDVLDRWTSVDIFRICIYTYSIHTRFVCALSVCRCQFAVREFIIGTARVHHGWGSIAHEHINAPQCAIEAPSVGKLLLRLQRCHTLQFYALNGRALYTFAPHTPIAQHKFCNHFLQSDKFGRLSLLNSNHIHNNSINSILFYRTYTDGVQSWTAKCECILMRFSVGLALHAEWERREGE